MGDVRYADVDGVRLAYRVTGDAAAPAMVVLHALGQDGSSWDEIAAAFGDRYRVYAPDMRGHGDSDRPGSYSFELMRDDVLGFLDVLGLDRVVLIGHSMGGSVAFLFVEEYPERVHRLVIEDTPPPFVGGEPVRLRRRRPGPLPYDVRVIEAIVRQLNDPDPTWWDRTSAIRLPTLIIAGGPDSHVPQDRIAMVADRIPDARLVTIPAGHHLHRERPREFIAAVDQFLGDRSSR